MTRDGSMDQQAGQARGLERQSTDSGTAVPRPKVRALPGEDQDIRGKGGEGGVGSARASLPRTLRTGIPVIVVTTIVMILVAALLAREFVLATILGGLLIVLVLAGLAVGYRRLMRRVSLTAQHMARSVREAAVAQARGSQKQVETIVAAVEETIEARGSATTAVLNELSESLQALTRLQVDGMETTAAALEGLSGATMGRIGALQERLAGVGSAIIEGPSALLSEAVADESRRRDFPRPGGSRPKHLVAVNIERAGLGNRLRFTLSAQAIAEAEGREFCYYWGEGDLFEPKLTDLWYYEPPSVPPFASTLLDTEDFSAFRDRPTWVIRSAYALVGDGTERPWEELLRELRPVDSLASQIAKAQHSISAPYVGVQVRASHESHTKTAEASPVEWYVTRMREILRVEPETQFYLSCDSAAAEERIRSEVAGVVDPLVVRGTYNSRRGVEASIVDLYLLSDASHILAPYWSSFAYLAYALGGGKQALETSRVTIPGCHPVGAEWAEVSRALWNGELDR